MTASPAAVRAYCNKVWNRVQNNWDLATGKNHVILGVDVDSSGNVFGIKVSSQPRNADAEAKAQAALTKSQPLDALPTGLPSAHLTITFDSTADPHGDSNSGGSVRLEYHPGALPATPAPGNDNANAGSATPGAAAAGAAASQAAQPAASQATQPAASPATQPAAPPGTQPAGTAAPSQ